jgi:GT2 family glycosyltransferase
MVTHGGWTHTERAIAALEAHTERPFELVVVDNASEDETRDQLSETAPAKVILNDRNVGFGTATNQGAAQARGKYLVLLNSDAFVHAGWLQPLLETLGEPNVGAVVPRYLHPGGSLQEAGVLLAQDGTVKLYGDGDDPARACYRFRRTVDYGSAVCLLLRRKTFMRLGGFDDVYAPAYYEDADLCLRLAEEGKRVVFEPRSTVTHVKYGSGGVEEAVELSARNRRAFVARWRRRLAGRPASFEHASDQATIWARDVLAAPRLLLCARQDEVGIGRLVPALLDAWPRGRVTWPVEASAANGGDRLRALGVELLDDADSSWLENRLFHYDAVLEGTTAGDRLLTAVKRTQPQAPRIELGETVNGADAPLAPLVRALTSAGLAPPASLSSARSS